MAAFDVLLALMLSICGIMGPVMTAKQTPWMHPCIKLLNLEPQKVNQRLKRLRF